MVKQRVGGAETLRVAALTDVLGGGNAPLAHVASRALGSVGRVRRREQSAATRAECDARASRAPALTREGVGWGGCDVAAAIVD